MVMLPMIEKNNAHYKKYSRRAHKAAGQAKKDKK